MAKKRPSKKAAKKSAKAAGASRPPKKPAKLKGLSKREMAELLPKSPQWLEKSNAPRNDDGSFHSPTVVDWYIEQETIKIRKSIVPPDPLMEWKTKSAEFDYRKKAGEYMLRDHVVFLFQSVVRPFSESLKTIEKDYGKPAADVLRSAIDRAIAMLETSGADG